MHFFRTIAEALAKGGTKREEAARLGRVGGPTRVLEELAIGTPEAVTEHLLELREALGHTTLSVWMNVGGQIPHERVLSWMRLFAERVIRSSARLDSLRPLTYDPGRKIQPRTPREVEVSPSSTGSRARCATVPAGRSRA